MSQGTTFGRAEKGSNLLDAQMREIAQLDCGEKEGGEGEDGNYDGAGEDAVGEVEWPSLRSFRIHQSGQYRRCCGVGPLLGRCFCWYWEAL